MLFRSGTDDEEEGVGGNAGGSNEGGSNAGVISVGKLGREGSATLGGGIGAPIPEGSADLDVEGAELGLTGILGLTGLSNGGAPSVLALGTTIREASKRGGSIAGDVCQATSSMSSDAGLAAENSGLADGELLSRTLESITSGSTR